MVTFVIIGTIIFLIWLFSGNESGSKHSNTTPPKYEPYDFMGSMAKKHYDLAWQCGENGEHEQAIIHYTSAILYKKSATYYNNRAHSKSKTNDYEGAVADYNQAIQLQSNEPLYFINRGFTHLNNNINELAFTDFIKAASLGSEKGKELSEKYGSLRPKVSHPTHVATKETDKNEILLDSIGISYLYHMTHKSNLDNILTNGLLSHNQAHKGLNQVDIADNQVNTRRERKEEIYKRSIHDYVPLYFNAKNPMLFKRKSVQEDIVILALDRNLILGQNSIFTDGNAASQSTKFFNSIEQLSLLNWQCIKGDYWTSFTDGKRVKCAEVLVFPKIDISSIKAIFTNNSSLAAYVSNKVTNFAHITVEKNSDMYFKNNYISPDVNLNGYYSDLSFQILDDLPF